jgi:hypothetical protein
VRRHWAQRIYDSSKRLTASSLAAAYLTSRDLNGPYPDNFRFNSGLRYKKTGQYYPALVAPVVGKDGEFLGILRTFLSSNTPDLKAPVSDPKLSLGPTRGGAVRATSRLVFDTLVLAEGVEDALTIAQSTSHPVWAAVGTGLALVQVPDFVQRIILAADADEPGRLAADKAAREFYRQGREVRIAFPPAGKDFNQYLRTHV